jgi:hypothetical protein
LLHPVTVIVCTARIALATVIDLRGFKRLVRNRPFAAQLLFCSRAAALAGARRCWSLARVAVIPRRPLSRLSILRHVASKRDAALRHEGIALLARSILATGDEPDDEGDNAKKIRVTYKTLKSLAA